jgi:type II secretory ATPase GspE/PulE/Tfp pilus assembly ATPase PilB-like protein
MNNKIIKTLAAYAGDQGLTNLTVETDQTRLVAHGHDGQNSRTLLLPPNLEEQLATSLRRILKIAENELATNIYYKVADRKSTKTFRFSIIPDGQNEKIIINVVPKNDQKWRLSKIGLDRSSQARIRAALKRQAGLIVVGSGPNQGRTATLTALADTLDKAKRLVYSLEKYNELKIDGLNRILLSPHQYPLFQLQLAIKSGAEVLIIDDAKSRLLSEAAALARTGRLIIVAIEAATEAEFQNRLKSAGLTSWLSEDIRTLFLYQTLAGRQCPHCLHQKTITPAEAAFLKKYWPPQKKYQPPHLYESNGCRHCSYRKTSGDIALFSLSENGTVHQSLENDMAIKAAAGLISLDNYLK